MTDSHKAALAAGRIEGRAVRDYLEALRANKPKRGRKRTAESITKRLAEIELELPAADAIRSLRLVQDQIDLRAELETVGDTVDMASLEDAFVKVAKQYGARNGISHAAWRQVGVAASVLKAAGISRGD
jgi:hypothetical protein